MARTRKRYTPDVHSAALVRAQRPDVDAIVAELVVGKTPDELTEAGGVGRRTGMPGGRGANLPGASR